MRARPSRFLLLCGALWVAATVALSRPADAQASSGAGPGVGELVPQIVTSATEEVEISPDRAMIVFAVETRAKTAAAAGSENARIQAAVLDTLRRLGILPAQLRTQGISIQPEYEYPRDGGRPTVVGYQARNSVQAEIREITRVGPVIDAGLARGATSVGALRFFASSTEQAEREALRKAMQRARAAADAVAEAAGGRIIGLLEGVVRPDDQGRGAPEAMSAMNVRSLSSSDQPTPIESGSLTVRVSVEARFRFAPR